MLVTINLDKVNVYHDISIYDFITIQFHWKTINDNIESSPSPVYVCASYSLILHSLRLCFTASWRLCCCACPWLTHTSLIIISPEKALWRCILRAHVCVCACLSVCTLRLIMLTGRQEKTLNTKTHTNKQARLSVFHSFRRNCLRCENRVIFGNGKQGESREKWERVQNKCVCVSVLISRLSCWLFLCFASFFLSPLVWKH